MPKPIAGGDVGQRGAHGIDATGLEVAHYIRMELRATCEHRRI